MAFLIHHWISRFNLIPEYCICSITPLHTTERVCHCDLHKVIVANFCTLRCCCHISLQFIHLNKLTSSNLYKTEYRKLYSVHCIAILNIFSSTMSSSSCRVFSSIVSSSYTILMNTIRNPCDIHCTMGKNTDIVYIKYI